MVSGIAPSQGTQVGGAAAERANVRVAPGDGTSVRGAQAAERADVDVAPAERAHVALAAPAAGRSGRADWTVTGSYTDENSVLRTYSASPRQVFKVAP